MMLNHGPELLFVLMMWETKILRKIWTNTSKRQLEEKNKKFIKKIISRDIVTIIKCRDVNGFVIL